MRQREEMQHILLFHIFLCGIFFSISAAWMVVPHLQRVFQADACHMNIGKYTLYSPHKMGLLNWKNKLYLLCNIFFVLHSILRHRYILLFCFCKPVVL